MPFAATSIDLEIIILSEVSQTEKDKYHMISLICGISNTIQINISTKQKQTYRHREQPFGCQGGEGLGSDGLGVWDSQRQTINIGWINNKVLLYSTGNYIQYPVTNYNGKEYEKEYIYICTTETFAIQKKSTQHCKLTILQ